MSITMQDIAEKSGVSRSAVSLILNKRDKELRISEAAKHKVLEAASSLGYCRNQLARSVVTGKSRTLAFISGNMGLFNYTGRIQQGILQTAAQHDYSIKLYTLDNDEKVILKNLREWQIAGVIFHIPEYAKVENLCKQLHKLNIPFALVNLSNPGNFGFGITTDDETGAFEMTRHLIEQGAKSLACFSYTGTPSEYSTNRINGFNKAAKNHPHEVIRIDAENAVAEIKKYLKNSKFDAVFCIADALAVQTMRAAFELEIKVPRQLKIAGFGDLDIGFYSVVPLSSVHQEYSEMGKLAAEAVINAIEKSDAPINQSAVNLKLPTILKLRASTQN